MANEDYKEIAKHYQELSNLYRFIYEDIVEEMNTVSELQGVYVEIKSDCIKYNRKHRKSAVQAENRLEVIQKSIKQMDYLINENTRLKEHNRILINKYCEATEKIKELEKQIEVNQKMWEEEND